MGIEIENLVTYSVTSTFSNYIVAKPKFWREWLSLAIQFYNYVELGNDGLDKMMTSYGSNEYLTSMKTFIQERLSCLILSQLNYRILAVRKNIPYPVFNRLFEVEPDTAQILKTLDLLKEKYIQSKDIDYLNMFYRVREAVKVIPQNQ